MGIFDLASAVRFLSQPTLSGFITGGWVHISSVYIGFLGLGLQDIGFHKILSAPIRVHKFRVPNYIEGDAGVVHQLHGNCGASAPKP